MISFWGFQCELYPEYWSAGVLEYWSEYLNVLSNTPVLHHSITPMHRVVLIDGSFEIDRLLTYLREI